MEAEKKITPEMVAHAFVAQFYYILHSTPEAVHRFFQDTSTMTRPTRDGSLATVRTMKDINDLIVSLGCEECQAEILSADAQASHKEGVIVLVTGCLTGKDSVRRKFTETFFLAPQTNGYYVLNNAFRFIEGDELPAASSVEAKESDENVTASTPAKEPEVVEVADKSLPSVPAAIEPVSNGNVDVSHKPDEQLIVKEPVVAEPPVELVNTVDDQVAMESSSDKQDGPKKSYASIVKDRKESMHNTPAHVPSTTTKKPSTNNGNQTRTAPSAPKPQANGTVPLAAKQMKEAVNGISAPNGNTRRRNDVDKTEEKGFSIYIGNLPFDATVEQVEKEFKKFGSIKRDGIQVRCSKGFCFGFIEFESRSSAQKAIETSPVQFGEYEAFVEEKKTSTRVVNGVSTFSGGRGGYRNDGFRGRGNFSGGRGYGRNDYGRRGGDYGNGNSNGNGGGARNGGDGYQRSYQNGGGRTVKQGGSIK